MKVGIIDPVGAKAGMDYYDLLLSKGLTENNAEVFLYSNFEYNGVDIRYHKFFFNIGVTKISAIASNFIGFFRALADAKKNNVDWLLLHVFRAGIFDLFTFSLAKLMGFKLAAVIHDIESLDTFTIAVVRKTVIGILPDKRIVHNEFSKEQLLKSISDKAAATTYVVPHINFTSLFEAYHEDDNLLQNLKNNSYILNQIDKRIINAIKSEKNVILFFGQIKKAKGLDVLIEAIALCKSNVQLIIAGKLRNESWEKYQQLINDSKVADKIIPIIRHITDEERDVLFSITECIVLPYRVIYQSGVLLMAMSFPLPVIASDLGPNKSIISHQQNGLLFQSENPLDLAKNIDEMISNKSTADKLKQQGFSDIRDRYNYGKIGAMMINVLQ